ncbi:hypothetical protein EVAR_95654_1 [Eumeta japonica]|uniref:Uncharacterized protein n=1 Tax=Eumeta variegata TaxID=151549 RepID=A0A4C1VM78_EUMVA|nr:hypothetical protein EVAR_95654_1 [Eumeta japonica]
MRDGREGPRDIIGEIFCLFCELTTAAFYLLAPFGCRGCTVELEREWDERSRSELRQHHLSTTSKMCRMRNGEQNLEPRPGVEIENWTGVKFKLEPRSGLKALPRSESGVIPGQELIAGTRLGLRARSVDIKDEGMHSISTRAKIRARS